MGRPEMYVNIPQLVQTLKFTGRADVSTVTKYVMELFARMPSSREDTLGFNYFCNRARVAWVRIGYIRELAKCAGPFPRRQEMRPDAFLIGVPPAGCQKFVVSHCWESEVHPSPSGIRCCRLVAVLDRLGAKNDDVAFLDFCSMPQLNRIKAHKTAERLYKDYNSIKGDLATRTSAEQAAFDFAMWDMGRLYAFKENKVIVLPKLDGPNAFPGGPTAWGKVNTRLYKHRGWCCSEFSIALSNGLIANIDDPDVQDIVHGRRWPKTVEQYADMMKYTTVSPPDDGLIHDPLLGVDFTARGDRDVVRFNFFKMTTQQICGG